jgi:Type IV secretion-system coupling protein DNA-binding domain
VHHPRLHRIGLQQIVPMLLIVAAAGLPGLAMAQASPFMTGATSLQTNLLILRCSGSENGGTSQFASRLIGDREVLRRQLSRGRDRDGGLTARGARRSHSVTEQQVTEPAVMPSELEQLPDLCGYFKSASSRSWLKVAFGNRLGPERRLF